MTYCINKRFVEATGIIKERNCHAIQKMTPTHELLTARHEEHKDQIRWVKTERSRALTLASLQQLSLVNGSFGQ